MPNVKKGKAVSRVEPALKRAKSALSANSILLTVNGSKGANNERERLQLLRLQKVKYLRLLRQL